MPFKKILFKNSNIIGFEAVGKISQTDYLSSLFPVFEKAREDGRKIKLMVKFGPQFKGYSLDAMWEDSKFGLRYLRTLEKVAVVSDDQWINRLAHLLGSLVACPVKVFNCGQTEAAKAWLEFGKVGLTYNLNEKTGVLTVKIFSAVSSEDFDLLSDAVDSHIERNEPLSGMALYAEAFPGWEDFGNMLGRFDFVKNYHRKIERVALVSDWKIAEKAPLIGEHFLNAKIKRFPLGQLERAQLWAGGGNQEERRGWSEDAWDQPPL